ncbi:MAG: hypothetical protein JOZ41_04910 [Chloroflexi bacterium]|nr:hypothetical protein [Chloroflexota bacterium]
MGAGSAKGNGEYRLLRVAENFFQFEERVFHEVGLYYKISLPSGGAYLDRAAMYRGATVAGNECVFRWFPLDALHGTHLEPPFLRETLHRLPACPEHLVERR